MHLPGHDMPLAAARTARPCCALQSRGGAGRASRANALLKAHPEHLSLERFTQAPPKAQAQLVVLLDTHVYYSWQRPHCAGPCL